MVVSHWRHQLPGSHATTRHHRRRGSAPFDSPLQGVVFPPMTRLSRFPPYCRRIPANKVAPLMPSQTRLIYGNFFTIKASRYEHTYFLSGYLHRLEFRIDLRGRRLILTGCCSPETSPETSPTDVTWRRLDRTLELLLEKRHIFCFHCFDWGTPTVRNYILCV